MIPEPHPTVAALLALDLSTVTPCLLPRLSGRKAQAQAARALFKRLDLKGISVTVPTYSMASTVQIRLPHTPATREQQEEWNRVFSAGGDTEATEAGQIHARRYQAEQAMNALLDHAFPHHVDRSDPTTDYFDSRWSVA